MNEHSGHHFGRFCNDNLTFMFIEFGKTASYFDFVLFFISHLKLVIIHIGLL